MVVDTIKIVENVTDTEYTVEVKGNIIYLRNEKNEELVTGNPIQISDYLLAVIDGQYYRGTLTNETFVG